MHKITITFNEDTAEITAGTQGIKGESCIDEIKKLLGDVDEIKKTDEFNQKRIDNQVNIQKVNR